MAELRVHSATKKILHAAMKTEDPSQPNKQDSRRSCVTQGFFFTSIIKNHKMVGLIGLLAGGGGGGEANGR